MENSLYYPTDKCPEELPSPKTFPTQGGTLISIKDYPTSFSDGFMLEVDVRDQKEKLSKKAKIQSSSFPLLLKDSNKATFSLPEPEYVYLGYSSPVFIFLPTEPVKPVGIQVRYFNYFRNRYPDCKFFTDGGARSVKAIRVGGKLVGLCMPMILPPREELERRLKGN